MAIGILAVQGAFVEHAAMLDRLGAQRFEIRRPRDLERPLDGLILPGGESTVMGKLLHDLGLFGAAEETHSGGFAGVWDLRGSDPAGKGGGGRQSLLWPPW